MKCGNVKLHYFLPNAFEIKLMTWQNWLCSLRVQHDLTLRGFFILTLRQVRQHWISNHIAMNNQNWRDILEKVVWINSAYGLRYTTFVGNCLNEYTCNAWFTLRWSLSRIRTSRTFCTLACSLQTETFWICNSIGPNFSAYRLRSSIQHYI